MKRYLVAACWLLGILQVSGTAWGDAQEAALVRAVAAKEMALEHPEPVRWQEAFDRFLEADALEASCDTKYELAFIAGQLRQLDLAVSYYEDAIRLGLSGPAQIKAQSFVAEYAPVMARLDVRGTPGTRLRVRGIERGTLPLALPITLFAGETLLEVAAPHQRQVVTRILDLQAGENTVLDLQPEAPASPQPKTPDVAVRLEARPVALPPPTSASAERRMSREAGVWLFGAGLGTVLTSGLMLFTSYSKLATKRDQLADACLVSPSSGSTDGCQVSKPGQYDEARSLASDIANWKTARAVGWMGLGLGAVSASLGIVLFANKPGAVGAVRHVHIAQANEVRSAVLYWQSDF